MNLSKNEKPFAPHHPIVCSDLFGAISNSPPSPQLLVHARQAQLVQSYDPGLKWENLREFIAPDETLNWWLLESFLFFWSFPVYSVEDLPLQQLANLRQCQVAAACRLLLGVFLSVSPTPTCCWVVCFLRWIPPTFDWWDNSHPQNSQWFYALAFIRRCKAKIFYDTRAKREARKERVWVVALMISFTSSREFSSVSFDIFFVFSLLFRFLFHTDARAGSDHPEKNTIRRRVGRDRNVYSWHH